MQQQGCTLRGPLAALLRTFATTPESNPPSHGHQHSRDLTDEEALDMATLRHEELIKHVYSFDAKPRMRSMTLSDESWDPAEEDILEGVDLARKERTLLFSGLAYLCIVFIPPVFLSRCNDHPC